MISNHVTKISLNSSDGHCGQTNGNGQPRRDVNNNVVAAESIPEESFECFGENDDIESYDSGNVDSVDELDISSGLSSTSSGYRTSHSNLGPQWMRSSFRLSPGTRRTHLNRQTGSFRLKRSTDLGPNIANGRGPESLRLNHGDPTAGCGLGCRDVDIHHVSMSMANQNLSDVSLGDPTEDDDVSMLYDKVQSLQDEIRRLAASQAEADERYARVKQENGSLSRQIHSMEENIRELELRADDCVVEEQRRHKELLERMERQRQSEVDGYLLRIQALEAEKSDLLSETVHLRQTVETLRDEKSLVESELHDAQRTIMSLNDENSALHKTNARLREENDEKSLEQQKVDKTVVDAQRQRQLTKESSVTAESLSVQLAEAQARIRDLQDSNRHLTKANEELECEILSSRVELGQDLLKQSRAVDERLDLGDVLDGAKVGTADMSLNDEMMALAQEKVQSTHSAELLEIRVALREQQDVNCQLRAYIDNILTSIMEKYPDLLEVKK